MERDIKIVKFEFFHKAVETIPVPVKAYGCFHEDNRDVLLVYEEELEEAA